MAETITTEQLLKISQKKTLTTEELLGRALPANDNPTLPQYLKYKLNMDKANAARSSYGGEAMWGRMDTKKAIKQGNKERDYWIKKAGPYKDLAFTEHPVKYVAGEAAQLLPYMITSQKEGLKYGLTIGGGFALMAAAAGQAGPQALVPEEFITVPAAFALGMKGGYSYGVINNILGREGGSLYLDMVENGISEDTARYMALGGGTLIGVIELAQFNLLAKPFKQAFSKTLRTKPGQAAIRHAVTRYAKTVAGEVAEEELQEVTSLVTETIAGMIDEKPDAKPTREEWQARLVETAARSLAGMAVIAAPGGAVDVAATARLKQKKADIAEIQKVIVEKAAEAAVGEVKAAEPIVDLTPLIEKTKKHETIEDYIKVRGIDPDSVDVVDSENFIVKNSAGNRAILLDIPIEQFGEPKFETLAQDRYEPGRKITDPIEATLKDGKLVITDGANRFTQAVANKDKTIPTILETPEAKAPALEKRARPVKTPEQVLERVKAMREKFKTEPAQTKAEIKAVQTELIDMLEAAGVTAKDKAKFIKTIKNIQTAQQYKKALASVQARATKYIEGTEKTKAAARIKKELKYTKPLKAGQRRVGKYDYESNKLFDALRGYMKLSKAKAQAELDLMPETGTEIELIKKRMLALQAGGRSASAALHKQVLADIQRMKKVGQAAKDEADFAKKLERQERVDEALEALGKIKGNKKTIKTKIGNIYRRGFSNTYSMLNSMFGKEFAEQYDPEIAENNRDTAIFFKTRQLVVEASRIYREKNITKVFENMGKAKYKLVDMDGLETEVSKLELIDIYNSLKNNSVKARYAEAFGEGQVQNLMGELTGEDVALADYLQEEVQEYREVFNQRSIETTGRDLGYVENYWPATSEYKENVFDDIRIQGETPSAMKERAKGRVMPKPGDAWLKAQRHIAQGEHVKNLSRMHETMRRLFDNRVVKHSIETKFGEGVYRVLRNQIDNISLNAQITKIDAVSGAFKFLINNWVTAKIALNPSTFVRQLMSVGNYMEHMSVVGWTTGFAKGIKSPKATFDFMWKNAPFLEARFNRGYTEAIKDAILGAEKLSANWGSYSKFLSSFARVGDITAIVYGGYPLVQAELAKNGGDIKKAMLVFEKATLKAQQSGLSSSLSQFQNSRNPFARLFLAFKNTANQYFRKMADTIITYSNGDIGLSEFTKRMTIYAIIQPTLYATSGIIVKEAAKGLGRAVGMGGEGEEDLAEKIIDSIMTQLVVGPANAVPVISDIVTYAMRAATRQRAWKVFSTPFLDDLETGIRKLGKKEPTAADYFTASASILEPLTSLPMNTVIRFYKFIAGEEKKSGTTPI